MESRKRKSEKPKLVHGAVLFGVALVVSLAIGMLLQSDDPEAPERAHASVLKTTTRPEAAGPAATVPVPASVTARKPAASATEPPAVPTYAEAEDAYFAGDAALAAELFTAYAAAHPGNVWAHTMRGLSLRRAGDLEGSEESFLRALELEPQHGKSLVNLVRTLLAANRPEEALPYATRAVEAEPGWADAHRVRGRVLHTLGLPEDALAAYRAALAIDPGDAWTLNNMGLIDIEAERFDEAADLLTRACEADATVATFRNNLGIALERSGRTRDAEAAFAAALQIDDTYEKARVSLARVAELEERAAPADPVLVDEPEDGRLDLAANEPDAEDAGTPDTAERP